MNALVQKFNNDKQNLRDEINSNKNWRKEIKWDSIKIKDKPKDVINKEKKYTRDINKLRNKVVSSSRELLNASNLDVDKKESTIEIIETIHTIDNHYLSPGSGFKKLALGAEQTTFEDKKSHDVRKKYEALTSKSKGNLWYYVYDYIAKLSKHAISLCAGLSSTLVHQTILNELVEFKQKYEEAHSAAYTKYRTANSASSSKIKTKKRAAKKAELFGDAEEQARMLLNWMVLEEYDRKGNKKFVKCNVTGDQLTLTDVHLKPGKRKRTSGGSYSGGKKR